MLELLQVKSADYLWKLRLGITINLEVNDSFNLWNTRLYCLMLRVTSSRICTLIS